MFDASSSLSFKEEGTPDCKAALKGESSCI